MLTRMVHKNDFKEMKIFTTERLVLRPCILVRKLYLATPPVIVR